VGRVGDGLSGCRGMRCWLRCPQLAAIGGRRSVDLVSSIVVVEVVGGGSIVIVCGRRAASASGEGLLLTSQGCITRRLLVKVIILRGGTRIAAAVSPSIHDSMVHSRKFLCERFGEMTERLLGQVVEELVAATGNALLRIISG